MPAFDIWNQIDDHLRYVTMKEAFIEILPEGFQEIDPDKAALSAMRLDYEDFEDLEGIRWKRLKACSDDEIQAYLKFIDRKARRIQKVKRLWKQSVKLYLEQRKNDPDRN